MFFSLVGVYLVSFNTFDLRLMVLFAAAAVVLRLLNFPMAPMILGFILGGMIEENLRLVSPVEPGQVVYTITPEHNGCPGEPIEVTATVRPEIEVSLRKSSDLSCETRAVRLSAVSLESDLTLQWVGPGGFSSSDTSPMVRVPGMYELEAGNWPHAKPPRR